ncbi:MAG: two-component system chemotaxis response regulator CheY, partial [Candidatus Latescibacterota bacterium]
MAYQALVVDDSSIARSSLIKMLRLSGIPFDDIYQADNGISGLRMLDQHAVDLVFTDINMPEMDGIAFVDILAERHIPKHIPIVVLSAQGSETSVAKLRRLGIRGYIRKPCTPEA